MRPSKCHVGALERSSESRIKCHQRDLGAGLLVGRSDTKVPQAELFQKCGLRRSNLSPLLTLPFRIINMTIIVMAALLIGAPRVEISVVRIIGDEMPVQEFR